MTASSAPQKPCQKCGDRGWYWTAGSYVPCSCRPISAPPSQRAELLTQELESAMAKLRTDHNGYWDVTIDRYEAAALLQHIAALTQRVEAIGRAVEIARKRGALALEIDVAMEAALSQEPRNG